MQDARHGEGGADRPAGLQEAPEDGAAFAARVAALTPAEREVCFPNHSDGQVCR
jgi:hypothetical protein